MAPLAAHTTTRHQTPPAPTPKTPLTWLPLESLVHRVTAPGRWRLEGELGDCAARVRGMREEAGQPSKGEGGAHR